MAFFCRASSTKDHTTNDDSATAGAVELGERKPHTTLTALRDEETAVFGEGDEAIGEEIGHLSPGTSIRTRPAENMMSNRFNGGELDDDEGYDPGMPSPLSGQASNTDNPRKSMAVTIDGDGLSIPDMPEARLSKPKSELLRVSSIVD